MTPSLSVTEGRPAVDVLLDDFEKRADNARPAEQVRLWVQIALFQTLRDAGQAPDDMVQKWYLLQCEIDALHHECDSVPVEGVPVLLMNIAHLQNQQDELSGLARLARPAAAQQGEH